MTFFFWIISGPLFSVRNQKTEKISKFQKYHTTTRKSRKKTSRVTLGTFFGRPNPQLEKIVAFHVKICLYHAGAMDHRAFVSLPPSQWAKEKITSASTRQHAVFRPDRDRRV